MFTHRLILILVLAGANGVFLAQSPTAAMGQPGNTQSTKDDLGNQAQEIGSQEIGSQEILRQQTQLAEQYGLLEEKLFGLHQYELARNPERSKLLQRAYLNSKEQLVLSRLRSISQLLEKGDLREANQQQRETLTELRKLLVLLQSEDRSKRIQDQTKRFQKYFDEISRIERIQRGLRGQVEGNVEGNRLSQTQEKNAERTEALSREIESNENATPNGQADDSSDTPDQGDERPQNTEHNPAEDAKSNERQAPTEPETGNPTARAVQQNLDNAKARMKMAVETFNGDAENSQSREKARQEMQSAERELAQAKKQLEEKLRQLREEEVGRMLESMEARFRGMLQRQLKINAQTQNLDRTENDNRRANFEIRTGKLSVEQNAVATDAGRALLVLREDGSSIAFPETVAQVQTDMNQVALRIMSLKIADVTQTLQTDIVESLEQLITALQAASEQESNKRKIAEANQPQATPGDQPLLDQLAELKMIRGLQQRIFTRHKRYSEILDSPLELDAEAGDAEIQSAILRLSERQRKLKSITRDIVLGKNK